ncbi:hypothetical protein CDD83_8976 [Cordyceps sp. RAO-2017]|nr:hypothetical protein CDD83_8976 [Cordyceps sp. RAO-2017]
MALVDYSSESEAGEGPPPAKRRRDADADADEEQGASALPPLPAAFHDLYASTVRQSVVDDPSLHQGRKRQTPHVPGNWPSHVYVEWHPTTAQHDSLKELLGLVEEELARHGDDDEGGGGDSGKTKLHNFLTSDLGAPLPLHISLSRPLSLRTADKDDFLEQLTQAVRSSGTGAFAVRPSGLAWYRSPDSDRTFLILRVAADDEAQPHGRERPTASTNPQLMALLTRCNTVSTSFNQPALYQRTHREPVDSAFHLSIGWTFSLPSDEASLRALKLFRSRRFRGARSWEIAVAGVKAKIGNVVTHIPLVEHRDRGVGLAFT